MGAPGRRRRIAVVAKSHEVDEMARELMRRFDALAREFLVPQQSAHLSRSEAALLRLLAEEDSASMSEISSSLGLALSSTTGVVDRLVERALVERARDENDRRSVCVRLTKKGQRALEALQNDRVRLGTALLERLPARERQTLLELFRKVSRD